MKFPQKIRTLFGKQKLEAEMAEELRQHLDRRTRANLALGMSPDEAHYAAQRQFGGVEQLKEIAREQRGWRWLEEFFRDVRLALRQLAKAPGFAFVVIATLALCIGANSAIFSVVNAILLRPYPWPQSERLVHLHNRYPLMGLERANCSIPDFLDRRAGVTALEESALYTGASFNLSTGGTSERVDGMRVTPSLFPLLKTSAALGYTFTEAEAQVGAAKTVVLSAALWKSRYGGDSAIVGKDIRLNGEPYTVVGVMPEGFYFPIPQAQLWVPFAFTAEQKSDNGRGFENALMIGRLRPGATVLQAQREVDGIHRALRERLPQRAPFWESSGFGGMVVGYRQDNVQSVRSMLWLLQAGVGAALLIGCANVANLLLARASARERELAICSALGASRGRIFRQLLVEGLVLFVLGGVTGIFIALGGTGPLASLDPHQLLIGSGVALDAKVVGITLLCTLLTGIGFSALPAWSATRGKSAANLKDAGTRATAGRRHLWLRSSLVVGEIALSLMLLATAGLLARSFQRLHDVSPGFSTENVLTARLSLPSEKYRSPAQEAAFVDQLLMRVRALPGVTHASAASMVPFSTNNLTDSYSIEGFTQPAGQPLPHAMTRSVSPDYFSSLGIPLIRGRFLAEQDTADRPPVVVIDRLLADRYWPGTDPVGHRIECDNAAPGVKFWTIVGVVASTKVNRLEENVTKETLYFPLAQAPRSDFTVVLKTAVAPAAIIAPLREAAQAIDPEQPLFDVKTMEARLASALTLRFSTTMLLGVFSGVALLLAALGVYGVLAFTVGQRTTEIGIRLALGATRGNILTLVLRQAAGLVALGILLGLAGYFASSTVVANLLFNTAATDAVTLLLAPSVLVLVALAACLIPARRAMKVDPIVALRAE